MRGNWKKYLGCFFLLLIIFIERGYTRQITIVVDLDGVLLRPASLDTPLHRVLELGHERYYIARGAEEFIASLYNLPNVNVAFFSGGSKTRNLGVLSQLFSLSKLTVAPSDLVMGHKRDLLDTHAITYQETLYGLFRGERYKKNLLSIDPYIDMENTIIVDDHLQFIHSGQEKNCLWAKDQVPFKSADVNRLNFIKDKLKERELIQKIVEDQNKLVRIRGIIEEAIIESKKSQINLRDWLWGKQWSAKREGLSYILTYKREELMKNENYLKRGLAAFKEVNSSFKLTTKENILETYYTSRKQLSCTRSIIHFK